MHLENFQTISTHKSEWPFTMATRLEADSDFNIPWCALTLTIFADQVLKKLRKKKAVLTGQVIDVHFGAMPHRKRNRRFLKYTELKNNHNSPGVTAVGIFWIQNYEFYHADYIPVVHSINWWTGSNCWPYATTKCNIPTHRMDCRPHNNGKNPNIG